MLNPRLALIGTGLVFGVWEALDAFRIEVPAFAAIWSFVFLGCTLWFWRRGSARAAGIMLVFFAFEVAAAPGWKDVSSATKAFAIALGSAGVAASVAVIAGSRRRHRAVVGA